MAIFMCLRSRTFSVLEAASQNGKRLIWRNLYYVGVLRGSVVWLTENDEA